jgi:hypothetical protein
MYRIVAAGRIKAHYSEAKPRVPMFLASDIANLSIPRERGVAYVEVTNRKRWRGVACEICGGTPVNAHHVRPVEQGGEDTPNNVVTLCNGCHSSVHRTGGSLRKKAAACGTLPLAERLLTGSGARRGTWRKQEISR